MNRLGNHTGAVLVQLQPMGMTYTGEVTEELTPQDRIHYGAAEECEEEKEAKMKHYELTVTHINYELAVTILHAPALLWERT